MHEHNDLGYLWPSLSGSIYECKTQSYVASVSDQIIVWSGIRETIKRSHCSGNVVEELRSENNNNLPAEINLYLSLCLYDTDTYLYIDLRIY